MTWVGGLFKTLKVAAGNWVHTLMSAVSDCVWCQRS